MPVTYFALLTTTGAAKLANAAAVGSPLKITRLAVGDGAGSVPTPDANRTALVNEVRRAPLNQLNIDPANSSQIVAEQIIPADAGGWWIREMGLYDESGALIAYANCAPSYKPLLAEGSGRTQTVRMVLIVGNTASVDLRFDASLVVATREYVDDAISTAINRLDYKQSVRAATTANITLSGLQTVDGIALAAGDRVLVKDQVAANENGIYVASAGVWVRSADADESAEVTPALTVSVESGASLADSVWQLITDAPISVGATPLVFRDITNGLARLASPAFTGSPTAPTPSPFDRDTSLATTEFVQRAIGNFSGQTSANTTRALTLDMAGQVINCGNTITVTLPTGTSEAVGATFQINNAGSGVVTVQAAAGQSLYGVGNSTARTFVLGAGDTVTVAYVGGASWYAWGGVQLGASAGFASFQQPNGYQRLPSGLIIQWGVAIGGTGALTSVYPIAFPNAVLQVTATLADKTIGSVGGISLYLNASTIANKTAITVTVNGSDSAGATAARYIAIGY
ncbi:phage tail protein [Pseudomonas sp. ZM23]|uniref:Phage tail protein n=1 Tax=Pseudomonas triclosanedens TaxID=2961893 RepID=A0ABY6ZZ55_9PSED|nr:phage tail protein [Pseudomonas triclosanedens]MCP8463089.1 phage tail protein [Pseudomonas triclosanedens]MCP8468709.1 phage tail protein [Pseudomonas triclosanedens]MCP8475431.1 phage tail protein [Pseudomonas triclosanedens]WAI50262.1 phage tail protein [Pseudomonas triclosanedens]